MFDIKNMLAGDLIQIHFFEKLNVGGSGRFLKSYVTHINDKL